MHCTTPAKLLYPILMHYWPVSFITHSTSPARRMANPFFSFPSFPPSVHASLYLTIHSPTALHTTSFFTVIPPPRSCSSPRLSDGASCTRSLFKWPWLQISHISGTFHLKSLLIVGVIRIHYPHFSCASSSYLSVAESEYLISLTVA